MRELRRNVADMFRKYNDVQVGAGGRVLRGAGGCVWFEGSDARQHQEPGACVARHWDSQKAWSGCIWTRPMQRRGCRTGAHPPDCPALAAPFTLPSSSLPLPTPPQTPEVIDLLIYKGREELEVRQRAALAAVCRRGCVARCVGAGAAAWIPFC